MKRARDQGVGVIEVTEVWCINRCTRQNCWWKRGESLSWVLDKGSSGITVATDKVGSATGSFDNFIRSTPRVSKFSDSTGRGIAGDLDTGCDKIADSEGDNRARCICVFTVDSTTFYNEKTEYSFSELGGRRRETKESMDVGSLFRSWGRVEREAEWSANSGNTANNIGTLKCKQQCAQLQQKRN
jgi:hypothetical protein